MTFARLYVTATVVKWRDLTPFSKFLFLVMGALGVVYVAYSLRPDPTVDSRVSGTLPAVVPAPPPDVTRSMEKKTEGQLVELLKDPRTELRDAAVTRLRKLWQGAAGPDAERRLQAGVDMLRSGRPLAAVDHFSKLVSDFPNFAEAHNQRAIAYFRMEDYERSIQDCLQTTELNKNHFGAWHGLGQCYVAIRRFDLALTAFQRALELQPFAEDNKRFIEFCKEKMKNRVPQDLNNSA
jgi:tetratricopeptide (TPR) repeat protein